MIDTLLQFPCVFPIKIIGNNKVNFIQEITTLIRAHFADTKDSAISATVSKNQNYIAITASLNVADQITLDALYQELTQHPEIKMVL